MTAPELSPLTWRARAEAEFKRLGGPDMPRTYDSAGIPRAEAINRAHERATETMLDEIHLMLRHVYVRIGS